MTILLIWAFVATGIFFNLRHTRLAKSPDHAKVASIMWPLVLILGGLWLLAKATGLITKHVVVDTAVSFRNVANSYRHGSLLPAKSSRGNALDDYDHLAIEEVNKLAPEAP